MYVLPSRRVSGSQFCVTQNLPFVTFPAFGVLQKDNPTYCVDLHTCTTKA